MTLTMARPAVAPAATPPEIPVGSVVAARILGGIALLTIWCLLFVVGLSSLTAARTQHLLYGQLRSQLTLETVPLGGAIAPGTPVALIEAPAINLRYVVVEGTSSGDLRAGPGHRRDTPLPGQAGASVIDGRSLAFGGPFRHITDLQAGDIVTVTTGQGTFTYQVDGVRRAGDPIPAPLAAGTSRLTLATSEGVSWRAGCAPDRVVYVDSTLQVLTQPAPSGRPALPASEKALAGDPGALVPLVLWLQLLLAVLIGAAWAQVRWGGAQTWLVGAPAVLAALWGASEAAVQLLPNLI